MLLSWDIWSLGGDLCLTHKRDWNSGWPWALNGSWVAVSRWVLHLNVSLPSITHGLIPLYQWHQVIFTKRISVLEWTVPKGVSSAKRAVRFNSCALLVISGGKWYIQTKIHDRGFLFPSPADHLDFHSELKLCKKHQHGGVFLFFPVLSLFQGQSCCNLTQRVCALTQHREKIASKCECYTISGNSFKSVWFSKQCHTCLQEGPAMSHWFLWDIEVYRQHMKLDFWF